MRHSHPFAFASSCARTYSNRSAAISGKCSFRHWPGCCANAGCAALFSVALQRVRPIASAEIADVVPRIEFAVCKTATTLSTYTSRWHLVLTFRMTFSHMLMDWGLGCMVKASMDTVVRLQTPRETSTVSLRSSGVWRCPIRCQHHVFYFSTCIKRSHFDARWILFATLTPTTEVGA